MSLKLILGVQELFFKAHHSSSIETIAIDFLKRVYERVSGDKPTDQHHRVNPHICERSVAF